MPIYTWRVSTYARDIYLYGNRTLNDVPADYVEPIKTYAAQSFTQAQIDNALANAWITQQEYADTLAYM
jgi:hypothetical protein